MTDLVVALGLVFALEGIVLAAFPTAAKQAMVHVLETPEGTLRLIGVASAVFGLVVVWLIRG
jgi:uncharacterized protein YjeT (DUF2065 family)